jgi:hypothetical protein
MKGKNKILIALTGLSLCAVLLSTPNIQAFATSIELLGVAWDHDNLTVYISLQKGVDPSYIDEVKIALNDWSTALKDKSENSNAFNFTVLEKPLSKKRPADITINVRKNTGTVLGSTSITSSGGIIKEVKITLAAYNALGLPLGREDFRTIARHELGHAIGLGHSNDNGIEPLDLMAPTYDFVGVGKDIIPSDLDLSAVLYIYGSDGFGGTNLSPIPPSYP